MKKFYTYRVTSPTTPFSFMEKGKDGRIETSSTIEILPRDISNAQFNFLGNSLNHIYDSCCCQTASKANEGTTLKRLSTVQHRKEDATLHT